MPLTLGFAPWHQKNVPGSREIRSKPLSGQAADLGVSNSRIPHEGGVCAVSCANMALRNQIWPAKASSPPRGLLLGTRRGSQVAAGRVGAARSPCWGRLRAAPVLGGYRDRLRGGRCGPALWTGLARSRLGRLVVGPGRGTRLGGGGGGPGRGTRLGRLVGGPGRGTRLGRLVGGPGRGTRLGGGGGGALAVCAHRPRQSQDHVCEDVEEVEVLADRAESASGSILEIRERAFNIFAGAEDFEVGVGFGDGTQRLGAAGVGVLVDLLGGAV